MLCLKRMRSMGHHRRYVELFILRLFPNAVLWCNEGNRMYSKVRMYLKKTLDFFLHIHFSIMRIVPGLQGTQ